MVLFPKNTRDFLTEDNPKLACLYLLLKIHKNIKNPPGRPIVSGNGGEPLSKYVDSFLKPLVVLLPSYDRDTSDILRKISNIHLVTWDVDALYRPRLRAV